MRTTPPGLAAVAGAGTLRAGGPDTPGGSMFLGSGRGAGPTVYFKIFQFNPRVIHSSIQIEL
jgi:hypothetical protein